VLFKLYILYNIISIPLKPYIKVKKWGIYGIVKPQCIPAHIWKLQKESHTHHKITNSAKIEAMHTIKLQVQQKLEIKVHIQQLYLTTSKCGIEDS